MLIGGQADWNREGSNSTVLWENHQKKLKDKKTEYETYRQWLQWTLFSVFKIFFHFSSLSVITLLFSVAGWWINSSTVNQWPVCTTYFVHFLNTEEVTRISFYILKKNRARMFGIISSFNFTMPKGQGWLTDQLTDVVVMQYGFFSHPWLCQMCTQPPCHKRISHWGLVIFIFWVWICGMEENVYIFLKFSTSV